MSLLHKTFTTATLLLLMLGTPNAISAERGGPASSIEFTSESFEVAKDRATKEGKLLFVDFYASWCTPCKWMESTTFADPEVGSVLNENYVSLKVDIDTQTGFALKEKFEISVLPTILIFNSQGELVERVQETLSRSKMLNLINFHLHSDNSVVKQHYFNKSPNQATGSIKKSDSELLATYKDYNRVKKSNYRVELGYFNSYADALTKVNDTREQFFEEIIVLNDYEDGKVMYRVLMGKFGSYEEAEGFKTILKESYNINSLVY